METEKYNAEILTFRGQEYHLPTALFNSVHPEPVVSLDLFRNRVWVWRKKKKLTESILQDCLYLDKKDYMEKYRTRKTWLQIDGREIEAKAHFKKIAKGKKSIVSYPVFSGRLKTLQNDGISLTAEIIRLAGTADKKEWRSHFGRRNPIEYKGKIYYTVKSLLIYLSREEDYPMIKNRLKLGWPLEEALKPRREKGGGFIYRITQKSTGLRYIGLTTTTVQKRWQEHKKAAEEGQPSKLYDAIRGTTETDFLVENIEKCDSDEILKRRERDLIAEFDTIWPKGLNGNSGGTLGGGIPQECEYGGEIFVSLTERARILGARFDLEPHIVNSWLRDGKPLTQPQRRVAKKRLKHPDHQRQYLSLVRKGKVSDEWLDPEQYFSDVRPDIHPPDKWHLVRPDRNRPWGPDNFTWMTIQGKIDFVHGKKIRVFDKDYPSIKAVSQAFGIGLSTLKYRLNDKGMTPEEAVSQPAGPTSGQPFTYQGQTFKSMNSAAHFLSEKTGLPFNTVRDRLRRNRPL